MHIHPRLVMRTRPVPVPTPILAESQELITHPAAYTEVAIPKAV